MRKVQPTAPAATRRHLPSAMRYLGACAQDEPLDVTLVLRRRHPMERPIPRTPRAEFAARYGADPADVERVRTFGRQHGMQEQACDMACRTLHWRGSAQSLQQAFGVKLGRYEMSPGGATFIGCNEAPTLPDRAVIAVLGLDRRPVAHPHFRIAQAQPAATYTPVQIGQLYAFPTGDGTGQTIAIIELGGG
ncbi:MAG: protease pro-enzyme activation domain-containing protein, partial [Rhodanobacteraceae bacterium]